MDKNMQETMMFKVKRDDKEAKEIILHVFDALKDKGYDPINQIIGYILSGDPTYITSHKNARTLIRKMDRDELLEEILGTYLKTIS